MADHQHNSDTNDSNTDSTNNNSHPPEPNSRDAAEVEDTAEAANLPKPTSGSLIASEGISFSVFEGTAGSRLTKDYGLDEDGNIVTTGTPMFFHGRARTETISRVSDLEQITSGLHPSQCIATGVFNVSECSIVPKHQLTKDQMKAGVRARSLEFMRQPRPGLALLDYDPSPEMPEAMRCSSPEQLMQKLAEVSDAFKDIGYSGAGSASHGITSTLSNQSLNKDGFHVYIKTDIEDLKALRKWLQALCWNNGYGYIDFGRNGVMLERCLVDIAVLCPERLIYEAPPVLGDGLKKSRRVWTHVEGKSLSGSFSLAPAQLRRYQQAVATAKKNPGSVKKAKELHERYRETKITELATTTSISTDEARRRYPIDYTPATWGEPQNLYLDDTIYLNGEVISVAELLKRGEDADQRALPDPIEGPEYGSSTATYYFNNGTNPLIHSFAHGQSTCFYLKRHGRLFGIEAVSPLDPTTFPNTKPIKSGIAIKDTVANLRHIISSYNINLSYDVIGKKVRINIPELEGSPDNFENSALSQITSLCSLNGMSTGQVKNYLTAIADQAQFNPVAEWITSTPWDGEDRLLDFYATLTTEDDFPSEMKEVVIFKWLLSAIAAAFSSSGFHSRGVLILQGAQSLGKTSWVRALIDTALLRETTIKVDHHLDPANKDSVVLAITHWIVELGEIESTIKKDMPRLKGFITSDADKVRLPYAPRESTYPRRTVFCATVNRPDFLVDDTGNTRWWTLPVTAIDYNHGINMQQLWAQVHHLYKTEKLDWWLTQAEEQKLEQLNQAHRTTSVVSEVLSTMIDFTDARHGSKSVPVMNATSILECCGKKNPNNTEAKECAAILREKFGNPTKSNGVSGWRVYLPIPAFSNLPDDEFT